MLLYGRKAGMHLELFNLDRAREIIIEPERVRLVYDGKTHELKGADREAFVKFYNDTLRGNVHGEKTVEPKML